MGRKKIEIRPLTEERNRNVTFLKRKAGLMKKAWELSVLCAADVSIVIFSAAGKAYEFSSKELDTEIERYHDYEGMIERRRAPEFEAMALAGEDDDDDEDDIRPSKSTAKNGVTPPVVSKSLKGKEVYKSRSNGSISKSKGKATTTRRASSEPDEKPSFIDGILSDRSRSPSDDAPDERERVRKIMDLKEPPVSEKPSAGLQYAFELLSQSQTQRERPVYGSSTAHHSLPSLPLHTPHHQPESWNYRNPFSLPNPLDVPQAPPSMLPWATTLQQQQQQQQLQQQQQHQPIYPTQSSSSYPPVIPPSNPSGPGLLPNNMQWDSTLLARYAEFQLQQNHQRQQRALLERQRQQLAELGVPLEDKSLLDELFGNSRGPSGSGSGDFGGGGGLDLSSLAGLPRQQQEDKRFNGNDDSFVWPTFGNSHGSSSNPNSNRIASHPGSLGTPNDLSSSMNSGPRSFFQSSLRHDRDDTEWAMEGDDGVDRGRVSHLPSPASGKAEDRRPSLNGTYGHGHGKGQIDKRDRESEDRRREGKRVKVDGDALY